MEPDDIVAAALVPDDFKVGVVFSGTGVVIVDDPIHGAQ